MLTRDRLYKSVKQFVNDSEGVEPNTLTINIQQLKELMKTTKYPYSLQESLKHTFYGLKIRLTNGFKDYVLSKEP